VKTKRELDEEKKARKAEQTRLSELEDENRRLKTPPPAPEKTGKLKNEQVGIGLMAFSDLWKRFKIHRARRAGLAGMEIVLAAVTDSFCRAIVAAVIWNPRERMQMRRVRKQAGQVARKISPQKAALNGGEISSLRFPRPESGVIKLRRKGVALAPVPHDPALFKPLVEILVAGGEKGTTASLVGKAKKISPELAKQVEQDAAWNPVSKAVLLESGPHVAAKWAARIGLPADSATDLAFLAAALGQIGMGYISALKRLDESLKKIEEAQGKQPAK
jgi:hypothetical protein